MNVFVTERKRARRSEIFNKIKGYAKKDHEDQPFSPIYFLHKEAKSGGNEDEEYSGPKEVRRPGVPVPATTFCISNCDESNS
jgi:hypothetical protein